MAPGVFVCAFLSLTAPFRKIKSISLSPRLQYGLICFYCNRVYPSDDPSKVFGLLWIDVIVLLRCVFHFSFGWSGDGLSFFRLYAPSRLRA